MTGFRVDRSRELTYSDDCRPHRACIDAGSPIDSGKKYHCRIIAGCEHSSLIASAEIAPGCYRLGFPQRFRRLTKLDAPKLSEITVDSRSSPAMEDNWLFARLRTSSFCLQSLSTLNMPGRDRVYHLTSLKSNLSIILFATLSLIKQSISPMPLRSLIRLPSAFSSRRCRRHFSSVWLQHPGLGD